MPVITAIKYVIPSIFMFSFKFLFVLNNTSNATPVPASKPDIVAASDNAPFR